MRKADGRNVERDEKENNGEKTTKKNKKKKKKKKSTYSLAIEIFSQFRVSSREISNDSAKYTVTEVKGFAVVGG